MPAPGGPSLSDRVAAVCQRYGYRTVPLSIGQRSGWLYANATLDLLPARFNIDTGASVSTLNTARAEGYRLARDPNARRQVASVSFLGERGRPASSAAFPFEQLDFSVYDQHFFREGRRPCDGLIGADYLHAHSAIIDYAQGYLHLLDPVLREGGLQGGWVWDAEDLPPGTDSPLRPGSRIDIDGAALTVSRGRKTVGYQLVIDPSAAPKTMDWVTDKGLVEPMIYALEGDTLTLAGSFGILRDRTANRPPKFRPDPDSGCCVIRFRRAGPPR